MAGAAQPSATGPTGERASSTESHDGGEPAGPSSSGCSGAEAPGGGSGDAWASSPPAEFFCPICMGVMRDPVVVGPTGQAYERSFIEAWLVQHASCPTTGQRLARPVPLVPVYALRSIIEGWARRHAPWLLDEAGHILPPSEQPGCEAAAAPAASPVPQSSSQSSRAATPTSLPGPFSGQPASGAGSGGAAELPSPNSSQPFYYPGALAPAAQPAPAASRGRLPHFSPAPLLPGWATGREGSPGAGHHSSPSSSSSPATAALSGSRRRPQPAASSASGPRGSGRRPAVPRISAAPLLLPLAPSSPSGGAHPAGTSTAGSRVARREAGFSGFPPSPSSASSAAGAGPGSAGRQPGAGQGEARLGRPPAASPPHSRRVSVRVSGAPLLQPPSATPSGSGGSGRRSRSSSCSGRSRGPTYVLPPAQLRRPRGGSDGSARRGETSPRPAPSPRPPPEPAVHWGPVVRTPGRPETPRTDRERLVMVFGAPLVPAGVAAAAKCVTSSPPVPAPSQTLAASRAAGVPALAAAPLVQGALRKKGFCAIQ